MLFRHDAPVSDLSCGRHPSWPNGQMPRGLASFNKPERALAGKIFPLSAYRLRCQPFQLIRHIAKSVPLQRRLPVRMPRFPLASLPSCQCASRSSEETRPDVSTARRSGKSIPGHVVERASSFSRTPPSLSSPWLPGIRPRLCSPTVRAQAPNPSKLASHSRTSLL